MEQSLFIEWVNKYFAGITLSVVETLNGTKDAPTYIHRRMLRQDFSVTGKWDAINQAYTLVAADVVAMDSSLPLKSRDTISRASGNIPKMGMELALRESQLTELDTLVAQGGTTNQILARLFADTPRVIGGIYEKLEAMFLEGLSTGVTVLDDTENVGTGIRIDYKYLAANRFGTSAAGIWSNVASTPFADMQRVITAAGNTGNRITRIMMDRTAFNNAVASTEVKQLFAFNLGFNGTNIPAPSFDQFNSTAQARLGVTIEIVDRSIRLERNGDQTTVRPWADGAVVFLTTDVVGSLVYARLAEQNHPVSNVVYQTADNFILVSKFRKNQPSLSEHTTSQARVVPVITGTDAIYVLDSKNIQA